MNKRVVFYGMDSQVGTTMLALSAAELLRREGRRVLFVSAGANPGQEYVSVPVSASLDDLRPLLLDGAICRNEIHQVMADSRGVDILPGVRSWSSGRLYMAEDLDRICSLVEGDYDHVIIDGGGGAAEGIQRAALCCSSRRILVVTQQEKTLYRFQKRKESLKEFYGEAPQYVVNKFNDSGAFYTEKQMLAELGCSQAQMMTVAYVPYGWQAEAEKHTLLPYRKFRRDIRLLAEWIRDVQEDGDVNGI